VVARIWALQYTYIGRAAFGMKNFVGFRGRRIGLLVRGNPTITELNRVLLKTVALSDRDVKGVDLRNFSDGINKLARGEIDAAPIIVGVPVIRKARAKVPLGLNYISLFGPRATTKLLSEQVPGLYVANVKPNNRLPIDSSGRDRDFRSIYPALYPPFLRLCLVDDIFLLVDRPAFDALDLIRAAASIWAEKLSGRDILARPFDDGENPIAQRCNL